MGCINTRTSGDDFARCCAMPCQSWGACMPGRAYWEHLFGTAAGMSLTAQVNEPDLLSALCLHLSAWECGASHYWGAGLHLTSGRE